jgi:hypothetical protein
MRGGKKTSPYKSGRKKALKKRCATKRRERKEQVDEPKRSRRGSMQAM